MPLYIAFIDLTKALDVVSREGIFAIFLKVGYPPILFNIVKSFHTNTKATVQYDGNLPNSFMIESGVNKSCVLAAILFRNLFSMLLKRTFSSSTIEVNLHLRSDGCLFHRTRLKAKRKIKTITERDLLFADDAALVAHSVQDVQTLLSQFLSACLDFVLTISVKNTKVLSQQLRSMTSTSNMLKTLYTLAQVLLQTHQWTMRFIIALVKFEQLLLNCARVWHNPKLTVRTK